MILPTSLIIVTLVAGAVAYPNGPPTVEHPEICGTMQPNHSAVVQISPPPFEIRVNAACYKAGLKLTVAVEVKRNDTYFEGMFVQARKGAVTTMSYGVFASSDKNLSPLDCFTDNPNAVAKNSIGHNDKAHYMCKNFDWTAPSDLDGDVKFVGTIVHETSKYWMNVESTPLKLDVACAVNSDPSAITCGCGANRAWLLPVVLSALLVYAMVD